MSRAAQVYHGSDGKATLAYYRELEAFGPIGIIAMNLFRACKASERAKIYRGGIKGKGSYRQMAYDKKNWSIGNLCKALVEHCAAQSNFVESWGWKRDAETVGYEWVLYVDLAQGQVSFHSATRMEGPDYTKDWDHQKLSAKRIIQFCDHVVASMKRPPQETARTISSEDLQQIGPAPWE